MPKRSSNVNQTQFRVAKQTTSEELPQVRLKNQAAVELGRLGSLKGGKARSEALTREQRTDIARKAARARWAKEKRRYLVYTRSGSRSLRQKAMMDKSAERTDWAKRSGNDSIHA